MKAIEVTGVVDRSHRLIVDAVLPIVGQSHVKVIVLYNEEDLSETEWLKVASTNPAFSDLSDPTEDVYTLSDGESFRD